MIRHLNQVSAGAAAAGKQKLVRFFRREMAGSGKRLATLVGCNYQGTRYELGGCINDVEAMRDTLVDRFRFDPDDVVVLTDAPGAAVVPTGANIRQALGDMIDAAGPGDVLFFHYSGHSMLIPCGRNRRDEAIDLKEQKHNSLTGEHASSKFSGARVRPLGLDEGILLSGCQTDETSADMPAGNGIEKPCGAFSNAVRALLHEHTALLSNRELVINARETLREQGVSQHPCLYCSDANADASFLFQSK